MDARGLAARLHDLPALPRRVLIAALIVAAVGIARLSLVAISPDAPIALWWPAIGVLFFAVLASRGRRLAVSVVVVIAVAIGNLLGGQPLELSLAYGLTNAIEVWVVVRVLTGGAAHARFTTLKHIGRFLISVAVGTLLFSILTAAAAALLAGADPALVASSLITSHASAFFAVAPLALVSPSIPLRVPAWEPLVQTLSLVFLTVVVFALAGALALTFLIITTLMWGAYRLPPMTVALQTVTLAVAATLATATGIGPFALLLDTDERGAVLALQLFIMTHAAAALFVSGQSADWNKAVDTLAARERDATLVADELLQLNAQKDDFISAVSHELRTPVTSILGFSEQLVDADLDPETDQAGRIIHRNARRLADVIEDVLELSRLSTNEGSTRPPADLDLCLLLENCIDDTLVLAPAARAVTVERQLPDVPVIIHAVEQDLVRVFSNLLTNALKFSPAESTVVVELIAPAGSAWVDVRIDDEGPGIPLAEQEAVWERFYRVQSPQHRDVPGTGLGLPIVRALVEHRIGGQVTLSSDGVAGTSVVVRIPRAPLSIAPPTQSAAR
ncbi:MAG: hypothetical protein B7Y93_04285 [Micrococcales bacterium 32-70-13]|nr:MAG: hypothetical protein B7Y93_04285 [Micrococcales bacterium 32-70-13]